MKHFLLILAVLIIPFTLFAADDNLSKSKGTTQDVIVVLTPSVGQEDVLANANIELTFTVPLDASAIKEHDIKLTYLSSKTNDHIMGAISYSETDKKLIFTPSHVLEPGIYEVEIKSLKADKAHKEIKINEIKYRFMVIKEISDTIAPNIILHGDSTLTLVQGSTYKELGAKATDEGDGDVDVTVSGSVDTSIEGTYTITYTATDKAGNKATATRIVNVVALTLTGISLESNVTLLNVGDKATLTITGTYSDDSTNALTSNVEWIVSPADSAQIYDSILTAKKDAQVSVQAKLGTVLSNTINLTIATIINGYALPPEPDPALNNATLLGVDSNGNGVRDDVERWIYITYKDNHPIHVDIALQAARASKKILEISLNDIAQAKVVHKLEIAAIACEAYYKIYAKYFNEPLLVTREISVGYFEKLYFNTPERDEIYNKYAEMLSGDTYSTPKVGEGKNLCDFNTIKYEE